MAPWVPELPCRSPGRGAEIVPTDAPSGSRLQEVGELHPRPDLEALWSHTGPDKGRWPTGAEGWVLFGSAMHWLGHLQSSFLGTHFLPPGSRKDAKGLRELCEVVPVECRAHGGGFPCGALMTPGCCIPLHRPQACPPLLCCPRPPSPRTQACCQCRSTVREGEAMLCFGFLLCTPAWTAQSPQGDSRVWVTGFPRSLLLSQLRAGS